MPSIRGSLGPPWCCLPPLRPCPCSREGLFSGLVLTSVWLAELWHWSWGLLLVVRWWCWLEREFSLQWECALEAIESGLPGLLLCCLCFPSSFLHPWPLRSSLLGLGEVKPALAGLCTLVTPKELSLEGLRTCQVISFRKAENCSFSFTKFCLASSFLCSRSFSLMGPPPEVPDPVLSPRLESTSMDLALRKFPAFPSPPS